jgi:FKBP-type peptidyl-prolyl cis-trans isomerase
MKRKALIVLSILVFSLQVVSGQGHKKKSKDNVELKTFNDTISYLIGADVATNIAKSGLTLNNEIFYKGFDKSSKNQDSLFTEEQKQQIMGKFQQQMMAKQQQKQVDDAKKNKADGKQFLLTNKTKEGVVELPSGLQYKILKLGTGQKPSVTDEVEVNYEGKLIDGTIFDSSFERGEPISFPLNGVIKGWTEGLQLMPAGTLFELYIPSDLAYGDVGNSAIPGGSTLIFKVELISIKQK